MGVSYVVRPINGKMTLVRKDMAAPLRPRGASSDFPTPRLVRAFSEPVQSMADGKYYDTPADLRRSYKASHNPQGVDYIEVGNEDTTKFTPPKRDRKADRDAIERAINDVENGNVPPVLTTDKYSI